MSHHQGMSIVSIANVLLDGVARHWGMGDARIEAVASLLHERAPREVPPLREPPTSLISSLQLKRSPGMFREVPPGMTAIEPTHLMSNGRYAVALRANGAGASRRGNVAITRSRDDALRDAHGWFFHVRWDRQPRPVSLTQHPAPDPAAHYHCSLHADRVAFSATWSELEATTTVWVSPEDDIEFRQVVLHNCGERTLDLELLSSFEVTLADPRADESHPAFSNLFVSAEWQAHHQAHRLREEAAPGHRQGPASPPTSSPRPSRRTSRSGSRSIAQRWLGRNRDASLPLAAFDELPAAPEGSDGATLDTGLDPVAAFAVRLQIAPNAKARLTFCTAATDDAATLRAVIDKYRQVGNIARASLMSATLTGIRLREMRINAENFAAIQTLSTALSLSLVRTHLRAPEAGDVCDRRLLWRFGISGDRPIVLVSAGVEQGLGLLRSLAQALRLWSWGGVACDLVVVNHEPASYLMPLQPRHHLAQAKRTRRRIAAQPGSADDRLSPAPVERPARRRDRDPARARARSLQRRRPAARPPRAGARRAARARRSRSGRARRWSPSAARPGWSPSAADRPLGDFAPAGGEFRFDVSALSRPARPWVNVLANPGFGAQISEAGGGYSWALNSRLNMLTPWSNDAVADPAGEWFVLQDLRTLRGLERDAVGERRPRVGVPHRARPGLHASSAIGAARSTPASPGASTARARSSRCAFASSTAATGRCSCASSASPSGSSARSAATAAARTPHCASVRAAPGSDDVLDASEAPVEGRATVLFCTQRDRSAGFGGGTAFFALAGDGEEPADWTCDRRELFDARGRAIVARPLRAGERLRPRPLRRAVDAPHAARRRFDRARLPARLRRRARPPRSRSRAPRSCRRCAGCNAFARAGTSCSARPPCARPAIRTEPVHKHRGRDRAPAGVSRARFGLHALLGARGAPRARPRRRSRPRARRKRIASEAVRDGLPDIGARARARWTCSGIRSRRGLG